jgi:hypothetical protein
MAKRQSEAISAPAAVAVAFLLFLHTFLTAFAAGAHASPAALDAFGNPLCLGSVGLDGGKAPADDRPSGSCCTFGCHLGAAASLPDRLPVLVDFSPSAPIAWRLQESSPHASANRFSVQPRGPPRLV